MCVCVSVCVFLFPCVLIVVCTFRSLPMCANARACVYISELITFGQNVNADDINCVVDISIATTIGVFILITIIATIC